MTSSRASTRRAALAAFLLFAAALFVVSPAEASRTTTDLRSIVAPSLELPSTSRELASLELLPPASADPVESSPRFGFNEDLGLLDPEAGPGGFVLFARKTSRCELTYARNNPLKYVDPDGRKIEWFGSKEEIRIAKAAVGTARNAHPRLEKLVDGLERSSNVFRISLVADDAEVQIYEAAHRADDEVAASNGTGTGAMIWLFSPNDVPLSVFMEDAVHEMSHAEDSDTGTMSATRLCKGCTTATETKAVRMENLLPHRRSDPKTTYNMGRERVPNPTRIPKDPRLKKEEKRNRVVPSS